MTADDLQLIIRVDVSAQKAFDSICGVSQWWTENTEGSAQKLNDEFTVTFGDVHYSKQKLVEFVPSGKVVWLVTESKLNFLQDKQEWNNTRIVFEIHENEDHTEIRFTHYGLRPASSVTTRVPARGTITSGEVWSA
jgi:hypothetical protein